MALASLFGKGLGKADDLFRLIRGLGGAGKTADAAADVVRGVSTYTTPQQALNVARKLPRERVQEIVNMLPSRRKGTAFVTQALGETPEQAAEISAIRYLSESPYGRARLGRLYGQAIPEEALPAGARRGLGERRLMELERAGKRIPSISDAGIPTRAGRFFLRRGPVGQALLAGGVGLGGYLGGREITDAIGLTGGPTGRPEGLTDSDLQAILSQVGGGATAEDVLNDYYRQATQAAQYTGVDPQLEQYLRNQATRQQEQAAASWAATTAALDELAREFGGTPAGAGQEQLARDVAASAGSMPRTAVSGLAPVSPELAEAEQAIRAEAARSGGGMSTRDQMLQNDLQYLAGVARLMGVETGQDINQRVEDLLLREALLGSRQSREAAQVLEQQRLEQLGNVALQRAKSGIEYGPAQVEQKVYDYANEWAAFTPQQRQIEVQRRALVGADEATLQRSYIESRLRQDGLIR